MIHVPPVTPRIDSLLVPGTAPDAGTLVVRGHRIDRASVLPGVVLVSIATAAGTLPDLTGSPASTLFRHDLRPGCHPDARVAAGVTRPPEVALDPAGKELHLDSGCAHPVDRAPDHCRRPDGAVGAGRPVHPARLPARRADRHRGRAGGDRPDLRGRRGRRLATAGSRPAHVPGRDDPGHRRHPAADPIDRQRPQPADQRRCPDAPAVDRGRLPVAAGPSRHEPVHRPRDRPPDAGPG